MAPPDDGGGSSLVTFAFMGAIFLVIYLFMIRPQANKVKAQKKYIDELKKGDKVVTNGGLHGKIVNVQDNTFLIEVDKDVKIKIEKSAVSMDLSKSEEK